MKHITLITAALLLSAQGLMAQNALAEGYQNEMKKYPPRFGVKAGPGIANLTVDNAGTVNDKKAILSGHAAIYVDMPLLPIFSIQAGVQVGSKGSKFTVGDAEGTTYTEVSTVPVYVEIPVNAVIKIPLVNKVKLFAGAGPYIACGVAGKNKMEGKLLGVSFSDDKSIDFNSDNNSAAFNTDLKRFDTGQKVQSFYPECQLWLWSDQYQIGLRQQRCEIRQPRRIAFDRVPVLIPNGHPILRLQVTPGDAPQRFRPFSIVSSGVRLV